MTYVDIIIILVMIFAAVRGVDIGFVRQAGGLLGLWLGLALGGWIVSSFSMQSTVAIVILIACIVFGVIGGEVAGAKLKELVHERKINVLDRVFGAVMGIVTSLVVIWLGSTLITIVSSQGLQSAVRDSAIIRYLDRSLPPATDAIASLETYLASTGIPDMVKTEEPDLGGSSTPLPDLTSFASVIAGAQPSTLEIEGRSCSGIDVGSGFIADTNLVMTNAHVVAGMRTPFVRDATGRHPARIVAFDPVLDIAVLRVDDITGSALPLLSSEVPKGTTGVVLGYPGGGKFQAKPAIVADTFRAIGKDIYGDAAASRTIYALRADIVKGNSGGPLLDEQGNVIGVIFARSTSYNQVGYALTSPTVLPVLEQAKTSPSPGDSLRCL